MSTYFVDSTNGSDSNNGLGPDASAVTNKPFKTIAKLIAASGVAVGGDVAYAAPGVYREQVTVGITPASELKLLGDPTNAQGFKTAGGVLVSPGEVRWTGYDVDDKTLPSGTSPTLSLNGKSFLTLQYWTIHGGKNGSTQCINGGTVAGSHDIQILDCLLRPGTTAGGNLISYTGVAGSAANWTIRRTTLECGNVGAIALTCPIHTAEYDINFLVENARIFGGSVALQMSLSGTPGSLAYGLKVYYTDFWHAITGGVRIYQGNAVTMTNKAMTMRDCRLGYQGTALSAGSATMVDEDYNHIHAATARSNVNAGANSKSDGSYAWLQHVGEEVQQGRFVRAFGVHCPDSPMLGYGDGTGGATTTDFLNRPRPAGGASASNAVGAFERHDNAIQGGSSNADGGTGDCIKLAGPSDHDVQIPVDATSTTISIKQKTSSYVGTNYPQIELLANPSIGVSGQTVTDSAANATYTTLTLSAFTPTAKGVVTLRLKNRTGDGAGIVYYDTLAVS